MKKNGGFTLFELAIAMAVIMVILAIVLIGTSGDNNDYRALHNASLRVQSELRYAQRRAVMEGRTVSVHFEASENRYYVFPSDELSSINYFRNGVSFCKSHNQDFTWGFRPRGTPSNAGTITLVSGRYQQQLTVVPSGGRVEIKDITIRGGQQ